MQAGTALGTPKSGDGRVEMIRALRVARRSAVKARTQAANQLHALVVTAADELRSTLRKLGIGALVATVSQWRPGTCPDTPLAVTRFAMKSIVLRYKQLSAEILTLDLQLDRLVTEAAPSLLALKGVGTEIAASLLIAAGDNPERLRGEAPSPISTGWRRFLRLQEEPTATASTEAAIGKPTPPSTSLPLTAWLGRPGLGSTSLAGPLRARPRPRSSAASNATSQGLPRPPGRAIAAIPAINVA